MRITARGQVTIPKAIRNALGLLPNTEVTIDVVDGEVRIRKEGGNGRGRGDEVVARLRGARVGNSLTTDEIMEMVRGEA